MHFSHSESMGEGGELPPLPHALSLRKSFQKSTTSTMKKPLKVLVVGQAGVGKSALTVRFITGRFIGDYDPTLEDIYTHEAIVNNETAFFQILDSGGHSKETEQFHLESNIRWAEAFILMYSVTDKCSFDECIRLKFFINLYTRKRHHLTGALFRDHPQHLSHPFDIPVILVANKADQVCDRMISIVEGRKRCKEIGCIAFQEISVKESMDDAKKVFAEVHARWKMWQVSQQKSSLRRQTALTSTESSTPNIFTKSLRELFGKSSSNTMCFPQRVTSECSLRPQSSQDRSPSEAAPDTFRARACTDGSLQATERWKSSKGNVRLVTALSSPLKARRMSFSMRGSSSSSSK